MIMQERSLQEQGEAMPSLNHSYTCTQILRQLFQQTSIFPMTELTLDIGNGLTPDISVYPFDAIHPIRSTVASLTLPKARNESRRRFLAPASENRRETNSQTTDRNMFY